MSVDCDAVDCDARGLKCPWPALRLARLMRERDSVTIVADDPAAPAEIAALAQERQWSVQPIDTEIGNGFSVTRRKIS